MTKRSFAGLIYCCSPKISGNLKYVIWQKSETSKKKPQLKFDKNGKKFFEWFKGVGCSYWQTSITYKLDNDFRGEMKNVDGGNCKFKKLGNAVF